MNDSVSGMITAREEVLMNYYSDDHNNPWLFDDVYYQLKYVKSKKDGIITDL